MRSQAAAKEMGFADRNQLAEIRSVVYFNTYSVDILLFYMYLAQL